MVTPHRIVKRTVAIAAFVMVGALVILIFIAVAFRRIGTG